MSDHDDLDNTDKGLALLQDESDSDHESDSPVPASSVAGSEDNVKIESAAESPTSESAPAQVPTNTPVATPTPATATSSSNSTPLPAVEAATPPVVEAAIPEASQEDTATSADSCPLCQNCAEFKELLEWRDVKKTAVAFVSSLTALYFVFYSETPLLSTVTWTLCWSTVLVAFSVKTRDLVERFLPGRLPDLRPFIPTTIALPKEAIKSTAVCCVDLVAKEWTCIRKAFLCDSVFATAKFALGMWAAHIVLWLLPFASLVTLAVLLAFSVPRAYAQFAGDIDPLLAVAKHHLVTVNALIESKLPGAKPKSD